MKLQVRDLTLAYGAVEVLSGLSFSADSGQLIAIVGPNGSGKSTLLRGISGAHGAARGEVLLDGREVRSYGARELARRLAILPQWLDAELDLTVGELVWRGRDPHRRRLRRATEQDRRAVAWAVDAADVRAFAGRSLRSLSGGERQRAWIALTLAQEPAVLLLDEPISSLDLRHQIEVMTLLRRLAGDGIVVLAVLHDLLLAARFADRVIAVQGGRIHFDGPPAEMLDTKMLEGVFGVPMAVVADPETGLPLPLPRSRSVA